MLDGFIKPGRISFILGGQFGSEGKGAAAAWVAAYSAERGYRLPNYVTTNAGVQSGHTSVHAGQKRVLYHLPTSAVVLHDINRQGNKSIGPNIYLNAGSIIDPVVLRRELEETGLDKFAGFFIHPNAAVVTQECRDAEMALDSQQTRIASTRKGVGQALSRKVLRSGLIARDEPYLRQFVRRVDLNDRLAAGNSILAEVPQGFSLSLNSPFYPHCTSRDCTIGQAMSDAGVHPYHYGASMLVVRTYPIRVGNIAAPPERDGALGDEHGNWSLNGHSGGAYPNQREITWEELGQTPEITTVTKRVRRVFSFSDRQLREALISSRPTHVFLTFLDYIKEPVDQTRFIERIKSVGRGVGLPDLKVIPAYGPLTSDVETGTLHADAKVTE